MNEVDKWLQDASHLGEKSAGGEFTLDISKALRKLEKFQLPGSDSWVLKFVQAATAAKSDSLIVRQTRRSTSFQFVSFPLPVAENLIKQLSLVEVRQPKALEHLLLGLRHLLGSQIPFEVICAQGCILEWNGSVLSRRKDKGQLDFRITVENLPAGGSRFLAAVRRLFSLESRSSRITALENLCHLAPLGMVLDKRRLPGLCCDRKFGAYKSQVRPLRVLTSLDQDLPTFPYTLGVFEARHRYHLPFQWFLQEHQSKGQEAISLCVLLSLHYSPSGQSLASQVAYLRKKEVRSEIVWLSDGVIVQREELPHSGSITVCVLASAVDLPTDLSGLKLRESRDLFERRAHIGRALTSLLREYSIKASVTELAFPGEPTIHPDSMRAFEQDFDFLLEYNFEEALA